MPLTIPGPSRLGAQGYRDLVAPKLTLRLSLNRVRKMTPLKFLLAPATSARACLVCLAIAATSVCADERRFGYTYEPETMPRAGMEFEQWITLRTQRTKAVGQQNFNR